MTEPIAVTAAALRTALGASRQEVLKRAIAGEYALAPSRALESADAGDRTYAFDGGSIGPDRAEALLADTIVDALKEAGLDSAESRHNRRIVLIVGTTLNGMRHLGAFLRGGPAKPVGFLTPGAVVSAAAARCGIPAAGLTISTACASGITAIGIACDLLRGHEVDVVLAGGYDPVSEFSHAGFGSLRLLAADRPYPFSSDRDGMRTAEGVALVVLERNGDAQRRGVRRLAHVAAVAESSDAYHLTQPHPQGEGAASALSAALKMGGTPDLIVAHATGTEANDAAEYQAYERAFGATLASTPVVAPKSVIGHTLGAAGAVDAALCIAMAESRSLLPALTSAKGIDRESFPALSLVVEPTTRDIRRTLNLALGFGGSNAALVLEHLRSEAANSDRPRADAPHAADGTSLSATRSAEAIVITGLGAIVPGAALAGAEVASLPEVHSGTVDDSMTAPLVDARSARRIAPISRLVRAVVRLALDDAGIDSAMAASMHAFCASQHGAAGYCVDAYREVVAGGLGGGNPLMFAESVPNVPGAQCSLAFGVRGAAISVIGSRVGFIEALWMARARMNAGRAERIILVAAEEQNDTLDQVLVAWKQARRGDAATAAGAVAMVLERESAAQARGARIRATLGEIAWIQPDARHWRSVLRAAESAAERIPGILDAPARPGLLGRLERRAVGTRLGATLGAEMHAVGPALLAATHVARGTPGAVLAIDSFGAAGLLQILAPPRGGA